MLAAEVIHWEDHYGFDHWTRLKDIEHVPHIIKSIGWIIHEDDKSVTLTSCRSSGGMVTHVTLILKSCIVKRKAL